MNKSLKTKLFGAVAALGLAVASTVGSTYAWFSMNSQVTVDGMQISTLVDSNLLVGVVGAGTGTANALQESDLKAVQSHAVTGVLQPVSTVDADDFYYVDVTKVNGDGSSTPGTGVYTLYDGSSTINGVADSKGYVMHDLVLKATATAAHTLSLTKFDVTYTPDASESGVVDAFRAALIVGAGQDTLAEAEADTTLSLVTILGSENSEYFQQDNAVDQAVASTSALGDVSNYGEDAVIDDTLVAGDTKYYRVQVMFWLEGEDKDCTNETFLALTGDWAVEINFAFEKAAVLYADKDEYNAAKDPDVDDEGWAALTTSQKTKTPAVAALDKITISD